MDPGAQPHGVGGQEEVLQEKIGLDLRPQRADYAEGDRQALGEKAALDPAFDAGQAVEVPVVADRWPRRVGLGQKVHQAVDVLP